MNIIEAIKSGKRINRKNDSTTHINSKAIGDITLVFNRTTQPVIETLGICVEDLLADDWEVEEEKIEVTKRQLKHVFENTAFALFDDDKTKAFDYFAKKLGFK